MYYASHCVESIQSTKPMQNLTRNKITWKNLENSEISIKTRTQNRLEIFLKIWKIFESFKLFRVFIRERGMDRLDSTQKSSAFSGFSNSRKKIELKKVWYSVFKSKLKLDSVQKIDFEFCIGLQSTIVPVLHEKHPIYPLLSVNSMPICNEEPMTDKAHRSDWSEVTATPSQSFRGQNYKSFSRPNSPKGWKY